MASSAEREMRDAVAAALRQRLPGARIVHELVIAGGTVRADIAAVQRDRLTLVELKSSKDNLKRAEKQMRFFVSHAHAAILVADVKFFDQTPYNDGSPRCAATDALEHRGGTLWVYPEPSATIKPHLTYPWRLPKLDLRQPRALDFLGLLWRAELVAEAVRHRLDAGRKMNMIEIAANMAWHMTGREIAEAVCRQIRMRPFPEADVPIYESGK